MYVRLKELRLAHNLLQKDLANILEISEISYTHYENEYYIMPVKYLNILASYFHVSLDYLFNFSNHLNYPLILDNIDCKKMGERLKMFRKENKLTQVKLADILKVGQSTIAEYERGTNLIATPFLYDICSKYRVSADYLLGKIDTPKYL